MVLSTKNSIFYFKAKILIYFTYVLDIRSKNSTEWLTFDVVLVVFQVFDVITIFFITTIVMYCLNTMSGQQVFQIKTSFHTRKHLHFLRACAALV